MSFMTEVVREEHHLVRQQLDAMRALAGETESLRMDQIEVRVGEIYRFLSEDVIPHANAEDLTLYPRVARLLSSPRATATMSRDHVEIVLLTGELAALRPMLSSDAPRFNTLRRVLHALDAILRVHMAKEEEIYLPLLDRYLTDAEAADLFEQMEQAVLRARRRLLRRFPRGQPAA